LAGEKELFSLASENIKFILLAGRAQLAAPDKIRE
jgi:hypothetical protein